MSFNEYFRLAIGCIAIILVVYLIYKTISQMSLKKNEESVKKVWTICIIGMVLAVISLSLPCISLIRQDYDGVMAGGYIALFFAISPYLIIYKGKKNSKK